MEITDDYVLKTVFNKKGKLNTHYGNKNEKENWPDLYEYIQNRYSDSLSYSETIYRIKNKIEIRPVCKCCGKSIKYININDGFAQYCSNKCVTKSKEVKEKVKQTNLERYGVENTLQSKIIREKIKQTNLERYGTEIPIQSQSIKEKVKQTNLEKYGVEYATQLDSIKEKIKETNLERYGNASPLGNKEIQNKAKLTSLEKYGTEFPNQSKLVKDKIKQSFLTNNTPEQIQEIIKRMISTARKNNSYQKAIVKRRKTKMEKYGDPTYTNTNKAKNTIFEKYGVYNITQADEIKEKIQQTNIEKYGYITPLLKPEIKALSYTPEAMQKKYATHKKNHTFNSSKIEQQFKEYLEQNYPNDFEYQYRSELYPFNCDFYIKSLNLYIEINGTWQHNNHPFDENNQEDIDKLNLWKEKNTKYYQNAINTWTKLDIKKRNTVKENNLNYLEIFSIDLNECIYQLSEYIQKKTN